MMEETKVRLYDLKVNYQKNPMGIDLHNPVFSWKIKESKGTCQDYSRVWISENEVFTKLVFDSGEKKVNSCGFTPDVFLEPGKPYYWKVLVCDDSGELGESEIAQFEGGHPEESWHGKWITAPFSREIQPVFSKWVDVPEIDEIEKARLYVCGLGLYEVYINGKKVGDQFLTPYFTDYRYWIQYQTMDVKEYLEKGENRIDIYLGNGWYKGKFGYTNKGLLREYYGDQFQVLADLYLWKKDGACQVLGTDKNWLALKSPSVFSGIYDGELYDARMERVVEKVPERQRLHAVFAEPPRGTLMPMVGLPVRKKETLKVKKLIHSAIGETILDFGQEITGWVRFRCHVPEGQKVTLQYSEIMQDGKFYRENLRTAAAEFSFISAGDDQVIRPHFTFYGFRYVKVTGMEVTEKNLGDFEAWCLYSELEETGHIETSNEKVNQLIQNTKWSQKDNFLDIPTDCPQRDERLGWTGDAQIFCPAASYHMETPVFYRKYLKDMAYEQRKKRGAVPYVVPDVLTIARQMNGEPEFQMEKSDWGEAGASVWGDAAVMIPWTLYSRYGNQKWLAEQYDNMKQWMDFIIFMDETYCSGKRMWTCGFHFGDWLSLDAEGDSREGGTDKYYVATLSYMHSAELTAKAAAVLEKKEDAQYYGKIAAEVKQAARKAYVTAPGTLSVYTQTAYVLAIWFQLFEEEEMEAAGKHLCDLLKKYDGHLSTGFVGTAYLCQALSKVGHEKEAYDLLLYEGYPGWLYEVNLGATTIWERWNSLMPDGKISSTGMNSLNHYAYGIIVEWIYERVCGLKIGENGTGPRLLKFEPQPDKRFSHVHATYESVAGAYEAGWEWNKDQIRFYFQVPFDCRAEVGIKIPMKEIKVNGQSVSGMEMNQIYGAGSYMIEGTVC